VGDACRAHARLFAVDLPGFGGSERRDDLLSPRAMGGFLARLVAETDLGRAHVVAPDVGTSAALFAAAAHPEQFASVIVGTGGAAVPLQLGEPLASWVLDPDLDKYRRMDSRAIVDTAVDTIAGGISDDIRDDYRASYDGDRFVESMRYVRRYPEELPELAELLPRIATRVTTINGRHDRVVPLANSEFLDERLPNSRQSPTLVIQGDNDLMIPTKLSHLMAGLIPDADIRIYPDAAHGLLFQCVAEVAADVNAFLGQERRAGS
jgi:pimeloyl-ACP methyl ester carboxylesterase